MFGFISKEEEMALARLEYERDDLEKDVRDIRQTLLDISETSKIRGNAKVNWLSSNSEDIANNFADLALAFETGNSRKTFGILAGMDPQIAKAVISIPVKIDESGNTRLTDLIEKSFSVSDAQAIAQIFSAIMESDFTPAFEDLVGHAPEIPVEKKELDNSASRKRSGAYKEDLQHEIDGLKIIIADKDARIEKQKTNGMAYEERTVSAKLDEIGKLGRLRFMSTRMDILAGDPSDRAWTAVKDDLKELGERKGELGIVAWLNKTVAPRQTRLTRLLAAVSDSPEKQAQRLLDIRGHFKSDASTSLYLDSARKASEGEMAKAFNALGRAFSGDFLRAGVNTVFAPAQSGFFGGYENNGKIQFCRRGFNESAILEKEAVKTLTSFLQSQFGFIKMRNGEFANPDALYRGYYTEKDKKIYSDYAAHSGWNAKAEKGEAHLILGKIYESRPGNFIQLGDKTLINKDAVDHAWVSTEEDKPGIVYIMGGRKQGISNIGDLKSAKQFLARFADAEGSVLLTDAQMVHVPSIANAWISDDTANGFCKLRYLIDGKKYYTEMNRDDAKRMLEDWTQTRGFIRLGDSEVINPSHIERASIVPGPEGKGEQMVFVMNGEEFFASVPSPENLEVMKKLEACEGFERLSDKVLLNTAHLLDLHLTGSELQHRGYYEPAALPVNTDTVTALFKKLAEKGNYVEIEPGHMLNMDMAGWVQYTEGALRYPPMNRVRTEDDPVFEMEREDAQRVLSAIESYGRVKALKRETGINATGKPMLKEIFSKYGSVFGPAPETPAPVEIAPQPVPLPEPANDTAPAAPKPVKNAQDSLGDFLKFKI